MAVATERFADGFNVSAKLKCNRRDNRRVTRVYVRAAIGFVIAQKHFSEAAVSEPAYARDIMQAIDFDFEGGAGASIRKALPDGGGYWYQQDGSLVSRSDFG